MIRALFLAVCLLGAGAAQAAPASVRIGDIRLDYEDGDWHVAPGVQLTLTCIAERCGEGATLTIGAGPIEGLLDDVIHAGSYNLWPLWREGDGPFEDADIERTINGLVVRGIVRASNCHAYTPPVLRAAFDHAGQRYHLISGLSSGCAPYVESVTESAFRDLVSGLRPAP